MGTVARPMSRAIVQPRAMIASTAVIRAGVSAVVPNGGVRKV